MVYLLFFACGLLAFYLFQKVKLRNFEKLRDEILEKEETRSRQIKTSLELELKQKEVEHKRDLEKKEDETLRKIGKEKERLEKREDLLDQRLASLEKKLSEIEKKEESLKLREETLFAQENLILREIEKLSEMTKEEARNFFIEKISHEMRKEGERLSLEILKETEEEADKKAAHLITLAINRLALPTVSEVVTHAVFLPNEEIKGRVIGREGRNIRALEYATGVNFVMDDTPNAVIISGLDPIRREIAKLALKELIKDGRIHPTRIEEVVEKTEKKVHTQIKEYGKEAAHRLKIFDLHSEIEHLLGKLYLQYSLGQNVLEHSIEVAFLMGSMADELGVDRELAKRIGLLHDMGKAATQEYEGSHALIGQNLALKFGESEKVANGIGCHHDEIPPATVEASLCAPADKISGGRLGARIEALDQYIKRAKRLETLSSSFEGVEKAYALQAGKEVRIIVEPSYFDDRSCAILAKEIAKKIEKEMSYSGKIKVTVIREKKSTEYAC